MHVTSSARPTAESIRRLTSREFFFPSFSKLSPVMFDTIPSDLSKRLNLSHDEGEKWIVNLIRETRMGADAKIDLEKVHLSPSFRSSSYCLIFSFLF